MAAVPRRLGFFGGTFDPIHLGHLILAQDLVDQRILDAVYFVPAAQNPLKGQPPLASAPQRQQMLAQAIADHPDLHVETLELERPSASYTVDTAAELARRYPEDRRVWILGADALAGLHLWKDPERLSSLLEFLVLARPGYIIHPPAIAGLRWQVAPTRQLDISASEIRDRRRRGQPVDFFLPETVNAYIQAHGIYNPPS